MAEPAAKDPKKQTAGRAGAQARWRGGGKGNIVALGSVAWAVASLPVGNFSPSTGRIMEMTAPQAGKDIDTLLKGTPVYAALTSGATAEKAMAGWHLGAPVVLSLIGDMVHRRLEAEPDNVRLQHMEDWLLGMLIGVLGEMGIKVEDPGPRPARPAAAPAPAPEAPSPPPEPVAAEPEVGAPVLEEPDDWPDLSADGSIEAARAAASASRLGAL